MKKLGFLLLMFLVVFSFSCKGSKKTSDDAESEDETTSAISVEGVSESHSFLTCDYSAGSVSCTSSKSSTSYEIKVSFSGVESSARSILTSYDSDTTISNATSSSYFTLKGKTPTNNDSNSYTVIVRDLTLCKESLSSSKCDVSGKESDPTGTSSEWDKKISITISTNTSSDDGDDDGDGSILSIISKYLEGVGTIGEDISKLKDDITSLVGSEDDD